MILVKPLIHLLNNVWYNTNNNQGIFVELFESPNTIALYYNNGSFTSYVGFISKIPNEKGVFSSITSLRFNETTMFDGKDYSTTCTPLRDQKQEYIMDPDRKYDITYKKRIPYSYVHSKMIKPSECKDTLQKFKYYVTNAEYKLNGTLITEPAIEVYGIPMKDANSPRIINMFIWVEKLNNASIKITVERKLPYYLENSAYLYYHEKYTYFKEINQLYLDDAKSIIDGTYNFGILHSFNGMPSSIVTKNYISYVRYHNNGKLHNTVSNFPNHNCCFDPLEPVSAYTEMLFDTFCIKQRDYCNGRNLRFRCFLRFCGCI